MSKIDNFCHQLGIRIVPFQRRRLAWETNARQSLRSIHASRGEGHLSIVLKCIKARPANAMELWSETIKAISDVLAAFPELEARGGALLDQFEGLDLARLRLRAKQIAIGNIAAHEALAVLLIDALGPELPQVEPIPVKRKMTVKEKKAREAAAGRANRRRARAEAGRRDANPSGGAAGAINL